MNRRIYKYPLAVIDEQKIMMPRGAQLLHVAVQHNVPCVWALVDADAPQTPRRLLTYGTGHPGPVGLSFVGTYLLNGGDQVFHVFDGLSSPERFSGSA